MLLVLAAFFNDSILIYGKAVIGGILGYNAFVESLIPTLFVILLMFSIKKILPNVRPMHVIFVLLALYVIVICYVVYPNNRQYYNDYNMDLLFTQAIPFFFLGLSVTFDKRLFKAMSVLSYVAIAVNFLYVFYFTQTRDMENDAMGWAYVALLPTLISICAIFEQKSVRGTVVSIIFSVIGAIYILSMGTRGPIIITGVYFLIMLWHKSSRKWSMKLLASGIIVLLVVFLYSGTYINALISLRAVLVQNGLSSRTIDLFLEGEMISYMSGRDVIYETIIEKLKDRPFVGFGTFGEWQFINYTAHNVWLELCAHYGYVFGTLLLAVHVFITLKAFIKSKNPLAKSMILLFACFAYVRSLFGGDYLYFEFTFLLGLSLHEIRAAKRYKSKS
jgi:hypothetical protein